MYAQTQPIMKWKLKNETEMKRINMQSALYLLSMAELLLTLIFIDLPLNKIFIHCLPAEIIISKVTSNKV